MTRYLECPCCGHPDCVPEGPPHESRPGEATWWDDQQVDCSSCHCRIRVRVTDDYADDALAWAECAGDECAGDEAEACQARTRRA